MCKKNTVKAFTHLEFEWMQDSPALTCERRVASWSASTLKVSLSVYVQSKARVSLQ